LIKKRQKEIENMIVLFFFPPKKEKISLNILSLYY